MTDQEIKPDINEAARRLNLVRIDRQKWVAPHRVVAVRNFGDDMNGNALGCVVHLEDGTTLESKESFEDTMLYLTRTKEYDPNAR